MNQLGQRPTTIVSSTTTTGKCTTTNNNNNDRSNNLLIYFVFGRSHHKSWFHKLLLLTLVKGKFRLSRFWCDLQLMQCVVIYLDFFLFLTQQTALVAGLSRITVVWTSLKLHLSFKLLSFELKQIQIGAFDMIQLMVEYIGRKSDDCTCWRVELLDLLGVRVDQEVIDVNVHRRLVVVAPNIQLTLAQWIRLHLPSCHPGFESQAHHLCICATFVMYKGRK